ncbi:hypothetical protein D918_05473, partial [Trichuris suis]
MASIREDLTYKKQEATVEPPAELREILDAKEFAKARLYKLDLAKFSFCYDVAVQIQTTASAPIRFIILLFKSLFSGVVCLKIGLTGEIYHSVWIVVLSMIISSLLEVPWSFIQVFVIEEKHGFNKQTVPFFIKDTIKQLLLSVVIVSPIIATLVWLLKRQSEYDVLVTGIYLSVIGFVLMTIYPEVIAPLFDKYTLLPDGELKEEIEKLSARISYPLKKIFIVEGCPKLERIFDRLNHCFSGSKRSSHSNAYLYGIWNNKRIVIYDTLLAEHKKCEDASTDKANESNKEKKTAFGMSNEEVLAVVGHEIGHWKLWHNTYNIIIMEVFKIYRAEQ